MIKESLNEAKRPVVSSDRWHIVHARWNRNLTEAAQFSRTVISEHDDQETAKKHARSFIDKLVGELAERPLHLRDQVFVRKPGYRSFKQAHRLVRKKS